MKTRHSQILKNLLCVKDHAAPADSQEDGMLLGLTNENTLRPHKSHSLIVKTQGMGS